MGSLPWDDGTMNFRWLLNLVFAVLVTIGLALSPLATPAVAHPQMAGMTNMSASGDMPCCPDEQKNKDCQDCPLVAMCVLKTDQAGPLMTEALPLRHAIRTTHGFQDDLLADGLDRPPPEHPPRNLT
jgi:hypothetical protein